MDGNERKEATLENAIKLFISTERLHRCVVDRRVACFGMHRSQHRMIMYLSKRKDPVSQKELAKEFEISPAAVAVACKKLESLGFIRREVSESDNRVNNLTVTEKGRRIAEESIKMFGSIDAAMLGGFSEDEFRLFMSCLEKMQNNLKSIG